MPHRTVIRRVAIINFVCFVGLLVITGVYHAISREPLYFISSPNQQYRVEITQTRVFLPIVERHVHLDAYRNGKSIVRRKLLYTGDFLDSDFRGLYPNPVWQSNSILEIGQNFNTKERSGDFRIVNETSNRISYILIESSWRKLILFDIEPRAVVNFTFRYAAGLSCEGEYAESKERFGGAVQVVDDGEDAGKRQFSITINRGNIIIESPQVALKPATCCASDRPDFDHE